MTYDEVIEATADAMEQAQYDGVPIHADAQLVRNELVAFARAVAPILMLHGARLVQEAAMGLDQVLFGTVGWRSSFIRADDILALDLAAIVGTTDREPRYVP